ncbi:hypothetical protein NDU88_000855 [Pleurodeles waltl]|uniref:Uncharacterized protein n=1 Tax=Pleurodeles waltl TaxID=8319 RepID=A0AAV7LW39_PLEWA|nr:hypothetical protein NDU88_000855 [Pleurodeles waltl]
MDMQTPAHARAGARADMTSRTQLNGSRSSRAQSLADNLVIGVFICKEGCGPGTCPACCHAPLPRESAWRGLTSA